jgi:hypothetical protein
MRSERSKPVPWPLLTLSDLTQPPGFRLSIKSPGPGGPVGNGRIHPPGFSSTKLPVTQPSDFPQPVPHIGGLYTRQRTALGPVNGRDNPQTYHRQARDVHPRAPT